MQNFNVNDYIMGLDLGQVNDYSALAILQRVFPHTCETPVFPDEARRGQSYYQLRYLQRYPLRTSYPDIVNDVINKQIELKKAWIVIDFTGVGRPVLDMFQKRDTLAHGISITGGDRAHRVPGGFAVPKRDLVACLVGLLQQQRLKIPGSLNIKHVLIKELQNFKIKVSSTGHDSYEAWRESDHDDLVLAVAMAAFFGDKVLRQKETTRSIMGNV